MHVHAGAALDAVGALVDDIGTKVHAAEIDAVNAKVKQGTATQVGTQYSLLELHHVAQAGVEQAGLTDCSAVKQFLYLH